MRELVRARATVALYRTFLLAEGPQVTAGRCANSRLTVPTWLVNGSGYPISSRAVLDGWQRNADDMTVEVREGIGHFVPSGTRRGGRASTRDVQLTSDNC